MFLLSCLLILSGFFEFFVVSGEVGFVVSFVVSFDFLVFEITGGWLGRKCRSVFFFMFSRR